jgi:peptide/nickel transport system substrate-binding protein
LAAASAVLEAVEVEGKCHAATRDLPWIGRHATGQSIGLEGKELTASRLTFLRRASVPTVLAALLLGMSGGCRREATTPPAAARPAQKALVSTIRGEPRTFNRHAGRDSILELFTQLTQARLVRVDRRTQELDPWLAESWTASADGLTYTVKLRPGVAFSDGTPFTSADVVFSFKALYDEKTGSFLRDSMLVGGKPLVVTAPDAATVVVKFPSAFGPGVRLLDNLPILPRHKLEAALNAGALAKAWDVSTPPSELVGLGAFVLETYQPGQRLVFARNPHYWRTDRQGGRLPALDKLTLEIVPDQNAEVLALQTGQIDFPQAEVRPEDYATLKKAADAGKLTITDVGVGLDADSFWLNLRPRPAVKARPWLLRSELRLAISHAVDRQAFADTVFLGAAVPVYGPITQGNQRWFAPDLPRAAYDVAEAKRLLASLGLADRNGDGVLEDRSGAPAGFTMLTQKGNTAAERGAAFLAEELRKVGLAVAVVPLEVGAVIDRVERGDYEAVYYKFTVTDVDPALNLELWLSSGAMHVWNPGQATPATPWEREIDELMAKQVAALDQAQRKALFDQVQAVVARELPMIQFVAPRIYIATSRRVANATPALLRPAILWNADPLGLR